MDKRKFIMKSKFFIVGIIIVILLGIGVAFFHYNKLRKNEIKYNEKIYNQVIDKIKNKDTFLLYLNNSSEECFLCDDATIIIDYYQKTYHLDVYTIDKFKMSGKYYQKLVSYINDKNDYFVDPTVIFIKKGEEVAVLNELTYEEYFKEFLIKTDFIKDNENEKMIDAINVENEESNTLDYYLKQDKNIVVAIYDYSKLSYSFRRNIKELSSKYDIPYVLLYYGRGNYSQDYNKIVKMMGKDISDEDLKIPMIAIVNKDKMIDYTYGVSQEEIQNFLIKNNIIH